MLRARINSTPRLFQSGCSLSFLAIALCAALCQGTRATSEFSYEDKVEGFYTPDQTWYGATVLDPVLSARPTLVRLLWDDVHGESYFMVVKVEHVRFKPMNSWEQGQCERVLIDDLTAIVLQYAMHAGEAKQILTADPTLVHFYCEYGSGFEEPGVTVMGAGDPQLNGLYSRKEVREGPSNGFPGYCNWAQSHAGRYWYEKDDGCHIRAMNIHDTVFANTYAQRGGGWVICGSKGGARYKCHVPAEQNDGLPPAQGWETFSNHFDMFTPVPTLRVVA